MRQLFLGILAIALLSAPAFAEIKTETVQYKQGDTVLIGYLAYDDSIKDARPGVVIFPEWWGLTDYPKMRARMLAELGYVAFAADMYGNGTVADNPKDAGALSTQAKSDMAQLRARAAAALDILKNDKRVDPKRIAAIGYCFGGQVALELARSGADIVGVVSFHGSLGTDHPEDAENIKGKILVCTGGDDAFIPPAQIDAFEKEMRDAKVDWQVNVYSGAVHAFTNPDADKFGIKNIAYNAQADHRSWEAMKEFFAEVFATGTK